MATRRARAPRAKKDRTDNGGMVMVVGFDPVGGGMSQIQVSAEVGTRYIDLHRVVPGDIERWSHDHIRWIVDGLKLGASHVEWETALILLAHHRSTLARDLLMGLGPLVPTSAREFYEISLGEAQSWIEEANMESGFGAFLGRFFSGRGPAN